MENTYITLKEILQKGGELNEKASLILQVIQENDPQQTSSTYFFLSLMQFLKPEQNTKKETKKKQKVQTDSINFNEQQINTDKLDAVLLLINILLPRLNPAILQKFFIEIKQMMVHIFYSTNDITIKKYTIAILSQIFQIYPENQFQIKDNEKELECMFDGLLSEKQKIRKQAQKSIQFLLEKKQLLNPLSQLVQQFILTQLQSQNNRTALHAAYFLNQGLKLLNIEAITGIVHHMNKNLQNFESDIATHLYLSIENLMSFRKLSDDLTEQILQELLSSQPNIYDDEKLAFAYTQAIVQTLLHLNSVSYYKARKYISSVIGLCCGMLQVENPKYHQFAQLQMQIVIQNTVNRGFWLDTQEIDDFAAFMDQMQLEDNKVSPFEKCVSTMRYLLSSRFQFQIKYCLEILNIFFMQLEEDAFPKVQNLIEDFLLLRIDKKTPRSLFQKCFSTLIIKINPSNILMIAPIDLNISIEKPNFEDESNLWLIPYINRHMKSTNLSFFTKKMLPLIQQMNQYNQDDVQKLFFQRIIEQIWQLMPRCYIIDEGLEETLLLILNQDLSKNWFLKSIEQLCINAFDKIQFSQTIQKYSEKLIPILVKNIKFNNKKTSLNAILALGAHCSQTYLNRVYSKNLDKLLLNNDAEEIKLKNIDILISILPSVQMQGNSLGNSLQLVRIYLQSQDSNLEKKGYRILIKLLPKMHSSFMKDIIQILIENNQLKVGSKSIRLTCLQRIWQINSKDFLINFLPEIICCIRSTNQKTRKISKNILQQISEKEGYEQIIQMIIAGFAGTSSLIKADSICAASSLIQNLSPDFNDQLLTLVLSLINDQNREIYKSILKFTKFYIKYANKENLKTQLPNILQSLLNLDTNSKDHSIVFLKHIIEKFIRKVGKDFVLNCCPLQHQKLIKYTDKNVKQIKKKKAIEKLKRKQMKGDDKEKQIIQEEVQQDNMNLLLKFDNQKEIFHFEENSKQKNIKKVEEKETFQVIFDKFRIYHMQKVNFQQESKVKQLVKKEKEKMKSNLSHLLFETLYEISKSFKEDEEQQKDVYKQSQFKLSKNNKGQHQVKESGQTFKAQNAQGDVRLQGKPDPYAFIQLNPKALNKRFQKKSVNAFQEVVDGPLKGLKKKIKK